MSRSRRFWLVGSLGVVVALVACDLNPQPLPPLDPNNEAANDGFGADAGMASAPDRSSDAGASPVPNEGADGGMPSTNDAGDQGDAATDAGADADADADAGDAG